MFRLIPSRLSLHVTSVNDNRKISSVWNRFYRRCQAMENISAAAKSLNTSSSALLSFSSQTEGIALCSAFVIEAILIIFGNLLTIVLFALKKRLRKKNLFLVVNMAFADVMLGAVSLPFFVFLVVGLPYQLWSISYDLQLVLDSFYIAFDVIFSHASVMSAVFISCERFYAVNWPLKHRTLSSKAYAIVTTIIWTLAIIAGAVYAALSVWVVVLYIIVFALCVCNIGIWRKFQKRNVTFSQQNRTVQNQRLTKTLLFVSAAAVLSWIPFVTLYQLIVVHEVSISMKVFYFAIFLNYSNYFINPIVYALLIPEFRQSLILLCSKRQVFFIQ